MDLTCKEIGVLIIESDPSFRAGVADLLRDDKHLVYDVALPGELPPLEHLSWVAVAIASMHMAGEAGLSFADRFHAVHPECSVILVAPYRTRTVDAQAAAREYVQLLDKPIEYEMLHARIHELAR